MSYYLGRSDFSSYRSSYEPGKYSSYSSSYGSNSWKSSYNRPSYDSPWRSSYSSYSSSLYKPKTYDFGSSVSSSYDSKYGNYSWRSRDYSSKDYTSKDYPTKDSKDYSSKDESTEERSSQEGKVTLTKDFSTGISSKDYLSGNNEDPLVEDFSTGGNSSKDSLLRGSKDSLVKDLSSGDNSSKDSFSRGSTEALVKDFSNSDNSSKEYSFRSKEYLPKEDSSSYSSMNLRKELEKYLANEDDNTLKDDTDKNTNGDLEITKDFSQTDGILSYERDKYESSDLADSTKKLSLDKQDNYSHITRDGKTFSSPTKKVYDFEDEVKEGVKDEAVFAEKEFNFNDVESNKNQTSEEATGKVVNGEPYRSSHRPTENYRGDLNTKRQEKTSEHKFAPDKQREKATYSKPKTKGRASSESGPVSMHREGIRKFISVVPEENRYITSVNYLPDRIELRLCGATPKEKQIKKWRSIPDLYNITLKPQQSEDEPIKCEEQSMAFAYDSSNEVLNCSLHKHDHMKEMYVTQYTHHFNPDEPRSHIAGWKVDMEPNGIPHEKSRMCVLKHPVVSGPNRRSRPRPKSAPPMFFSPESPEDVIHSQKVDVVDRGYYTLPRSSRNSDNVFYNGIEDSTDASSLGYAPSDDTSDSSAFYNYDPRSPTSKDHSFSLSKPKLIRLSAEFPGIRNLEKMRRKRQSMGSVTSPSPRDGEYGFFVALTSGNSPKLQSSKGRSYSQY